jgi:hypothetical protein
MMTGIMLGRMSVISVICIAIWRNLWTNYALFIANGGVK